MGGGPGRRRCLPGSRWLFSFANAVGESVSRGVQGNRLPGTGGRRVRCEFGGSLLVADSGTLREGNQFGTIVWGMALIYLR